MNDRVVNFTQKKLVGLSDIYPFASLNPADAINYRFTPPLNIFNLKASYSNSGFTAVQAITANAFIPFFIHLVRRSTLDSQTGNPSKVLNTFKDRNSTPNVPSLISAKSGHLNSKRTGGKQLRGLRQVRNNSLTENLALAVTRRQGTTEICPALITNRGVNFARHPKFRALLHNVPTPRLVKWAHLCNILFQGVRQVYPFRTVNSAYAS